MTSVPLPPDLTGYGEVYASWSGGRRAGLRALGLAATAAAAAGAVLPLLPTVPFALVAAWAFARSSPDLEARLLSHRRLGPVVAAWRERGAIPRRAKGLAVVSVAASGGALWTADPGLPVLGGTGLLLTAVAGWIVSRPHA